MASIKPHSAGVLLYRRTPDGPEILLAHPGGPYWRGKDQGAWQIPKGLVEPGETAEATARREAEEELGIVLTGTIEPLGTIRQAGGKIVEAFALEQDVDPAELRSNLFEMEWPRGSGRSQSFPEIDAIRWMTFAEGQAAILASQRPLLDRLQQRLSEGDRLDSDR